MLYIPVTVGDIYGCSPPADSDDLVHGGSSKYAALSKSFVTTAPWISQYAVAGTLNLQRIIRQPGKPDV